MIQEGQITLFAFLQTRRLIRGRISFPPGQFIWRDFCTWATSMLFLGGIWPLETG